MVITRRIPLDELRTRMLRDLPVTIPAGHATEDELERREYLNYRSETYFSQQRRSLRKISYRGGALN